MRPYIVRRKRTVIGGNFVYRRCDRKRLGYVLKWSDRDPKWNWVAGSYGEGGRFCGSRHEACMFLLGLHKPENPSQSP